ncbi:uncharacterized protein BDZ99DRAFT_10495 [Mytilinidion resinicola]|uniref:Uncharacterized protein n=1 Tax=Mytilinidion resinicola TaxID=574789 RepID=A0A6A6ZA68_9PEZI|nr:uncharacterized protein BDZ99DRAFT_10495 [Mytilinidion resinicola]KAF2817175.1 hypothetical protein BDZ99DRAFT_10495 [Mytilinidion resinicola]
MSIRIASCLLSRHLLTEAKSYRTLRSRRIPVASPTSLSPEEKTPPRPHVHKRRRLDAYDGSLTSDFDARTTSTNFMSLPRELRDEIYTWALIPSMKRGAEHEDVVEDGNGTISFHQHLNGGKYEHFKITEAVNEFRDRQGMGLFGTNKQLKEEVEEVFFKRNSFLIPFSRSAKDLPRNTSLLDFHRMFSSAAFTLIRRLEMSLSNYDVLFDSSASNRRRHWQAQILDNHRYHDWAPAMEAELRCLEEADPQYKINYDRICSTTTKEVSDKDLQLFATWVQKLKFVFKMPSLQELKLDIFECRWTRHWDWDVEQKPAISARDAALEALLASMRDRKKSELQSVLVVTVEGANHWGLDSSVLNTAPGWVSVANAVVWTTCKGKVDRGSTADCDINYSADERWGSSKNKTKEG